MLINYFNSESVTRNNNIYKRKKHLVKKRYLKRTF